MFVRVPPLRMMGSLIPVAPFRSRMLPLLTVEVPTALPAVVTPPKPSDAEFPRVSVPALTVVAPE